MNDIDRKQSPLQIVSRDTAVEEILQIMERRNVSAVLVLENGVVVGTVTDRDIAMKALLCGKAPSAIVAYDVMTAQVDGCIGKALRSELHILE